MDPRLCHGRYPSCNSLSMDLLTADELELSLFVPLSRITREELSAALGVGYWANADFRLNRAEGLVKALTRCEYRRDCGSEYIFRGRSLLERLLDGKQRKLASKGLQAARETWP